MSQTEIFKKIKNGEISPCYLFEGEEEYVKKAALDQIKSTLLDPSFAMMNDSRLMDPDGSTIIAANETLPFMDEKRVVTVYDSSMLDGKKAKYNVDQSIDQIKEYLAHLPTSSVLIFYVRGKADSRKKLYQAIKKHAQVVTFDRLEDTALVKWIMSKAKENGKTISKETCEYLFFTSGRDLYLLQAEIQKLSAFLLDKEQITMDDIALVCSKTVEYKVYDMANFLLDGQGEKAFSLLQEILKDGEDRFYLLALLGKQVRQLLSVLRLSKKRVSSSEMASKLGLPSFVLSKLLKQAQQYSMEQLVALEEICLNTEYEMKSGQIYEEGSLERIMFVVLSYYKQNKEKRK